MTTKRAFPLAPGLVAVLAALTAAAAVRAQPASFADVVEVELVVVDVFVADRQGNPVLDLEREDFRVFQDGRPVEISQLTPAMGGASGAAEPDTGEAAAGAAGTAAPRRLVIFVDNIHLHPNSRLRVFKTLSRRLESYLAPEDEVMIVTYGGTTEVALPMTRDRGALQRALREQARPGAISLLAGYDDRRVLDTIEERHFQTLQGTWTDPCTDIGFIAHAHADQVHGRVLGTIAELERFVNSLAGYDGRKMLLHVSDGIPLIAGVEAYRFASELCDGSGMTKGIPNAVDTAMMGNAEWTRWDPKKTWATLREFDTADEWTRLAAHANTYQVSFYPFQANLPTHATAGVDRARTSFDVAFEAARNDQDALFLLADETGGVAMLDANDIEPALDRVADDARFGYQLAYEPPTPGDGRQHAIRVEVDRPGVEVRHRKSYRSKRSDERVADRVVSALVHGRESNPLAVGVDITDKLPAERDVTHVKVRIRIPLGRLVMLPEGAARHGLFTVFVAARNQHGLLTPVGQKTVPLRMPTDSEQKEYVYTVELPFRGDSGDVAVAVHDQIGGEISFLRRHLRL